MGLWSTSDWSVDSFLKLKRETYDRLNDLQEDRDRDGAINEALESNP